MDHYLYKRSCEEIIYHLQTKLQFQLPDELRHDIYTNVLNAVKNEHEMLISRATYAESEFNELFKTDNPRKLNELRITLAQHIGRPITAETVLEWMLQLDKGKRIRLQDQHRLENVR